MVLAALSGAGVTITVAVAVAVLGIQLSSAKERLGDARVDAEKERGEKRAAIEREAAVRQRAELAEKRLRDADALVAEVARDMPSDGAFERLLRAYSRARSLDGAGGASVPDQPATSGAGSDDLLKPGD